jgi:GH15 family glucan-1,4-alpha-glucosidase
MGRYVWGSFPRMDSDPFFCTLLDPQEQDGPLGCFDIELINFESAEQRYVENTAILETILRDDRGGVLKIVDFAPRYNLFGRSFHPIMTIRNIISVAGSPVVRINLRPAAKYGSRPTAKTYGSNHIRFDNGDYTLRLTTNVPISTILDGNSFIVEHSMALILGPDESVPEDPVKTCREMYGETKNYWQGWSRALSIPFEWQREVIRAAITLKLCTFEDTGAVLAAHTTSVPEAADSGRNWDYRYCWLRDSYYTVQALNRLGATRTMKEFLRYLFNLIAEFDNDHEQLQPVYGISGHAELTESQVDSLAGYRGMGPVRIGNDAYRGRKEIHTYSSIMCWAACDRLARIAVELEIEDRAEHWAGTATRIRDTILTEAWNEDRGSFVSTFGGKDLDASLLIMTDVGFIDPQDSRFLATLDAVEKELKHGPYMFRYNNADDFGVPETAFNVCTFWYINALAAVGRHAEARELFENMLARRNALGLLSEDLDPKTGELWGNFPQTYSMVGIIMGAMRLSRSWEEAL